jgi:hypothetical protein
MYMFAAMIVTLSMVMGVVMMQRLRVCAALGGERRVFPLQFKPQLPKHGFKHCVRLKAQPQVSDLHGDVSVAQVIAAPRQKRPVASQGQNRFFRFTECPDQMALGGTQYVALSQHLPALQK